jgi:hypothetical protein
LDCYWQLWVTSSLVQLPPVLDYIFPLQTTLSSYQAISMANRSGTLLLTYLVDSYYLYGLDNGLSAEEAPPPQPIKINGKTYNLTTLSPPLKIDESVIVYNDEIYHNFSVSDNAECISSGRYSWGFSAWFLIISVALHGVWCIFMYSVWLWAQRRSLLCRQCRKLGTLRAVSDLGDAMRGEIGPEIGARTEKQLTEGLKQNRTGVKYTFEEAGRDDGCLEARLVFVGSGYERVSSKEEQTGVDTVDTRNV